MNDIFDNNKRKVISELLEVISKGVELIATEYLDKNLYDAFERYVISTLKVVDSTFATNYAASFSSSNNTSVWSSDYEFRTFSFPYSNIHYPNSVKSLNRMQEIGPRTNEYKVKLQYTLQQLVSIVKVLMYI